MLEEHSILLSVDYIAKLIRYFFGNALDAITKQQKEFNATEQWVSVSKGNQKGITFYEAKGFIVSHERDGNGRVEGESYISLRYRRKI